MIIRPYTKMIILPYTKIVILPYTKSRFVCAAHTHNHKTRKYCLYTKHHLKTVTHGNFSTKSTNGCRASHATDKSSCFSAEALLGSEAETAARQAGREWKGGDVIDACAAPGNKAMHAASLLSRMGSSSACGEPDGAKAQDRSVCSVDQSVVVSSNSQPAVLAASNQSVLPISRSAYQLVNRSVSLSA